MSTAPAHRLQCRCGALAGLVAEPHRALRGHCYCRDCRACASHLGVTASTVDAHGGIEFVATQARYVSLLEGADNLACISLTGRGLLRWYARCCSTPIGNTVRNWKFPYVGLVHTCLRSDAAAYAAHFPSVRLRVNTASALVAPPRQPLKTFTSLMGFVPKLVVSGFTGAHRATPFFNADGEAIAAVEVLSDAQRERAYAGLATPA